MSKNIDRKEEQLIGRGFYKKVRISVRTLDILIITGIAAIIAVMIFGISNNGYTVSFDSKGGSDVSSQSCLYGDVVDYPEPTREGYVFEGWYLDDNYIYEAGEDMEVTSDLVLKAKWSEAS